jgi:ATP-dependent protease ClpP protease subunit
MEDEENDNEKSNKEIVTSIGNHIYFYTDVNQLSALQAVKIIKKLNNEICATQICLGNDNLYNDDDDDTEDKVKYSPIYFHINSCGGNYFNGLAIVDAIRLSKVPVYTIGEGAIGSMASVIFLSGKKRFINKNAYVLIHEIRTFLSGTFSNLKDEFDNCKLFMEKMIKFYKENTKIPKKELMSILKKDIWIDAENCMKWKLADKCL